MAADLVVEGMEIFDMSLLWKESRYSIRPLCGRNQDTCNDLVVEGFRYLKQPYGGRIQIFDTTLWLKELRYSARLVKTRILMEYLRITKLNERHCKSCLKYSTILEDDARCSRLSIILGV